MTSYTRFAIAMAIVPIVSSAIIDLPVHRTNGYAVVQMDVGTPPVTHKFSFDTGSETSWIFNSSCTNRCRNLSGYPRTGYNNTASSSSINLGTRSDLQYIGATTSGTGVSDVFSLHSSDVSGLTWNQTFIDADLDGWPYYPSDGFFALAFNTNDISNGPNGTGTNTVVETLMQQGLLDKPRFGIYYGNELNNTDDKSTLGAITLGGSKEDVYVDGEVHYLPVQRYEGVYGHWQTILTSVTGSRSNANSETKTNITVQAPDAGAIFDSGASTIGLPSEIVSQVYESIGWNYTALLTHDHIPLCSEFNSSWSVTFDFGGGPDSTLTLYGDEIVGEAGFGDNPLACFPPFEDSGIELFALLGHQLLQRFYTVYDFGSDKVDDYNPRFGFGKLKEEFRLPVGISEA